MQICHLYMCALQLCCFQSWGIFVASFIYLSFLCFGKVLEMLGNEEKVMGQQAGGKKRETPKQNRTQASLPALPLKRYRERNLEMVRIGLFCSCFCLEGPPKTGSGTDRGGNTVTTWQYYEDMPKALGGKSSIEPPLVVASLEGPSTSVVISKDYSTSETALNSKLPENWDTQEC